MYDVENIDLDQWEDERNNSLIKTQKQIYKFLQSFYTYQFNRKFFMFCFFLFFTLATTVFFCSFIPIFFNTPPAFISFIFCSSTIFIISFFFWQTVRCLDSKWPVRKTKSFKLYSRYCKEYRKGIEIWMRNFRLNYHQEI